MGRKTMHWGKTEQASEGGGRVRVGRAVASGVAASA